MFSKAIPDHAELAEDFDRGFGRLREDGTYAAIVEKYGLSARE